MLIREPGDLIIHWVNSTLKPHIGIIIEVLPEDKWVFDYTIPVYKVLSSLGYIEQYTEAALRDLSQLEE